MDIFALDELLQAGKNLVAGCENDRKGALSTGFMKQFGLHGGLQYSGPVPFFAGSPTFKPPRCFRSCAAQILPEHPPFDETAQKIVRAIAHSNTSSHGTRTTIVSLATTSFGSVLATSLVE